MMKLNKQAFTMIELVFVIVILGILAAVAIPRLVATRTDAQISKGRADISSIRSSIVTERQSRLITGDSKYIKAGTSSGDLDDGTLFGGVLTYGITSKDSAGHWHSRATTDTTANKTVSTVKYKVANVNILFTYKQEDGTFSCVKADTYCSELTD